MQPSEKKCWQLSLHLRNGISMSSHEREKLKDVQKRQARYYNSDAHDLPELNEGENLRLKPFILGQKEWKRGVVVERLDERSYEIETADGSSYRRNRAHLKKTN